MIEFQFESLPHRLNARLDISRLLLLIRRFSVQAEFWRFFIGLILTLWDCVERILANINRIDRIQLPNTLLVFLLKLLLLGILELYLLRLKQVISFL